MYQPMAILLRVRRGLSETNWMNMLSYNECVWCLFSVWRVLSSSTCTSVRVKRTFERVRGTKQTTHLNLVMHMSWFPLYLWDWSGYCFPLCLRQCSVRPERLLPVLFSSMSWTLWLLIEATVETQEGWWTGQRHNTLTLHHMCRKL